MRARRQPSVGVRVACLFSAYLSAVAATYLSLSEHQAHHAKSTSDWLFAVLAFPAGLWNLFGARFPLEVPYLIYVVLGATAMAVRSSRAFYALFAVFLVVITVNVGGCHRAPF
jgi:hypothetical protein